MKYDNQNQLYAILIFSNITVFLPNVKFSNEFQLFIHRLANFSGKESSCNEGSGSALTSYTDELFDSSINWEDIKWLRS